MVVEQVSELFVLFCFFLFEILDEIQQITVSWFYTNKQSNNKDLSSERGKSMLVCLCRWVCVCMFWVQRGKRHDCVRTLPCTTSSSEVQRRHRQLYWCLSHVNYCNTHTHTQFGGSLLPQSQTNSGTFQSVRLQRNKSDRGTRDVE